MNLSFIPSQRSTYKAPMEKGPSLPTYVRHGARKELE